MIRGGKGADNLSGQGGGDRLFGYRGADTLRGDGGADVLKGGRGSDSLDGGRGRDRLLGGPGDDTLFDHSGATYARPGPGRFVVDVRDRAGDDHVDCRGASGGVVYADRNDSTSGGCRRRGNRVLHAPSGLKAPGWQSFEPIWNQIGSGTNEDAYRPAETNPRDRGVICDPNQLQIRFPHDTCSYTFHERYLEGAWANEYVPAYRCPDDRPFLVNVRIREVYNPLNLPPGLVAWNDHIDVSISGEFSAGFGGSAHDPSSWRVTGTQTGFPNSSATNWIFGGRNAYQIQLFCVTNRDEGIPCTSVREYSVTGLITCRT